MANFTEVLSKTIVASTQHGVTINNKFINIPANEVIAQIKQIPIGNKDGAHFLRTELILSDNGACLPRANSNTVSMANLLILDCDKRIDKNGEILEGAPDPYE